MNPQDKIADALALILQYGDVDGAHHKQWLIDQIVRVLVGNDDYPAWVANFERGELGPHTYSWKEGIAP